MSNVEFEDDIVFAKFINYMKKALYHRRLNYFRDMEKIKEYEVSINEIEDLQTRESIIGNIAKIEILTNKEANLLNLHYKRGLSYIEISKITGEKVSTLYQRRNRAILKLKKRLEE